MIIFEERNGATVPIEIESKLLKERIILLNGELRCISIVLEEVLMMGWLYMTQ